MANDKSNGGNGEKPRDKQDLSEEVVEQIKRTILFGEGQKRPPESTRFKKGQSGNPKGRPKRPDIGLGNSRSANALALREGERLIGVREGEEVRQIPAFEAVLRAQYVSATRGNAYSQKHIIERYDWAERERRQQRMNEIELWTAYVADQSQAIADAEAKGETPPTPLPHPDDVLIDYEKGIRFIGPINEEQLAQLEENLRLRDVLIMQDALDQREADTPAGSDPLDGPGTAMVFAEALNQRVPHRYKRSDTDILMRVMCYGALPKRDLLKQLRREWRAFGVPVRRGTTLPSLRFAKQLFELIDDHLTKDPGMR